jgi:hypothetical protein
MDVNGGNLPWAPAERRRRLRTADHRGGYGIDRFGEFIPPMKQHSEK